MDASNFYVNMKKIYCGVLFMIVMINAAGCGGSSNIDSPSQSDPKNNTSYTEYISEIPASYFKTADKRGSIVKETYRSRDYTLGNSEEITKTAYVYLPYGYNADDKETRYNILYLMHGWTMTAEDFFYGGYGSSSDIVSVIDNLIQNNDISPVIVVCATFDAENQPQNFSRSVEELSVFHKDFREDLVPYIESKYNTYAENVTEEGLQRSRGHRAFGGFSLGAVTTWYQFIYNLDYVKYFLPMSGDCWIIGTYGGRYYPVETTRYFENIVSNGSWSEEDFFIYQGIGTADPIWEQTNNQIQEMQKSNIFTPQNLHYAIIQDGRHDTDACERYLYHALQTFFIITRRKIEDL